MSPVLVDSVQIERGLRATSRDSGGFRGPGKGNIFPGDHSRAVVIYFLTFAASLPFFSVSTKCKHQTNSFSRRRAGRTSVHCRHVHAQHETSKRGTVINSCVTAKATPAHTWLSTGVCAPRSVLNGRWSAYPILIAGNALLRCSSNTRARFPEALQIHQLFDLSLSSAGLVGSFAATSNVRGVRTDRIAHFCRFIQSGEADLCGVGAKEGKRTRVRVSEVAQELERAQEREREREQQESRRCTAQNNSSLSSPL